MGTFYHLQTGYGSSVLLVSLSVILMQLMLLLLFYSHVYLLYMVGFQELCNIAALLSYELTVFLIDTSLLRYILVSCSIEMGLCSVV